MVPVMAHQEYLVRYGKAGDFGRFYAVRPPAVPWRRGERVVVRGHRGVEVGTVLGEARAGHAAFLPNTSVGAVLRAAGPGDEAALARLGRRADEVYRTALALAGEMAPGLVVMDVELMLEGDGGVVHVLGEPGGDLRPWVDAVRARCGVRVTVESVSGGVAEPGSDEGARCDRPDCGEGACSTKGHGCATCALPELFQGRARPGVAGQERLDAGSGG